MSHDVHKQVGKKLSKSSLCYVLITCQEPTQDGNMQVEMTYEGDAALASYLLQGAQLVIDEQETEVDVTSQKKILSIGG